MNRERLTFAILLILALAAVVGLIGYRAHKRVACDKKTCPNGMVPKNTADGCVCLTFAK